MLSTFVFPDTHPVCFLGTYIGIITMTKDGVRRAAEMLLHGATLLAQPCPYCSGVRVIKDGRTLCASCGSEPERHPVQEPRRSIEQQVLELTAQLGSTTDATLRKKIIEELTRLSHHIAK